MATFFYFRANTLEDLIDAHMRLTGGNVGAPTTPVTMAGWYSITVNSGDSTITHALKTAGTGSADKIYLTAALVGATARFPAGNGADTFIITKAFADGIVADTNGTTAINIPNSTHVDVFEFEAGIEITGANFDYNPATRSGSGNVTIGFLTDGTARQLTMANANNDRFKLGENGKMLTPQELIMALGDLTTKSFTVNDRPVLDGTNETTIATISYMDSAGDDTFAISRGTFTAANAEQDEAVTFSVANATALTFVGEFTHEVVGDYGTLRYNTNSGAWRFVADDTEIELLGAGASETDTFAVTATDAAGNASVSKNLVINVAGAADTNTPTVMEDLAADDGLASTTIHGVKFTRIEGKTENLRINISFQTGNKASAVKSTDSGNFTTYIFLLTKDNARVSPDDLVTLWEGPTGPQDRHDVIMETVVNAMLASETAKDLEANTPRQTLTAGELIIRDAAVTLVYDDMGVLDSTHADYDLEASGSIDITDPNGIMLTNITATAASGTVTFAADDSNSGNTEGRFIWTYTLNPHDPQAAAIAAGMGEDTIIISFTDDAGSGPTTLEIDIAITVNGDPAHLADANTRARDTVNADTAKMVTVDWADDSMDSLTTSGTLTITDSDGVASITHTAAQYGAFSFDQATGEWEYTLDRADPQAVLLTAGAHTETITFTITDGATPANTATHNLEIAIAVTGASARTAPTTTPPTGLNVAEGSTPVTFAAGDFNFTESSTGGAFKSLRIVTLPEVGILALGGTAVTAGQDIPMAQIPTLTYNPGDSFGAHGMVRITYAVIDAHDVRSDNATFDIAVTADDDEATGIGLSATSGTVPSNAPLTTLARIEFTDPDGGEPGDLQLVTPGATPSDPTTAPNDWFELSPDGRELRLKAGQTLTEGDTASVRVQLMNTPTIGANYALTVGGVNAIPTATPVQGLEISEDTTLQLGLSHFGFADTDAGDKLVYVKITTPLTTGALTLGGVKVAAGQIITRDEIESDTLIYNPGDSFSTNNTGTITYSVSDGKHESTAANMMITVMADDDKATGVTLTDAVATLPENAVIPTGGRKVADVTLTDPDGGQGGALEVVEYLRTAASVSVMASGGSSGDPALVLTAVEGGVDGNDITILVQSDAGLPIEAMLLGDMDNDPRNGNQPEKVRVAAQGNAIVVTYNADATGGVTLADIESAINGHKDANKLVTASRTNDASNDADAFAVVQTMLTGGTTNTRASTKFQLNTAMTELHLKDSTTLTDGEMLTVRVRLMGDDSVGEDYTLTIGAANAIPTAADQSVDVVEEAPYTFEAGDFGFMDTDQGDALVSVTIVSLPVETGAATPPGDGAGVLMLDGVVLTADNLATLGANIAVDDIGKLVYTPAGMLTAGTVATFTYSVNDGKHHSTDMKADGTSADPTMMTIRVEADDDLATGLTLANATSDLANAEATPGRKVADITLSGDPDGGSPGVVVPYGMMSALFEVVMNDQDGSHALHLKTGATIPDDTTLSVRVQLELAPSIGADYTLTIGDPGATPTATPATDLTVAEDATDPLTFTEANFGFADTDQGDMLVSVTIVTLPAKGVLLLDRAAVAAGDVIMAADIIAGNLTYDPMDAFLPSDTDSATNAASATFTYTVSDGKNSSPAATMNIAVTGANDDRPVLAIVDAIAFDSGAFVFARRHFDANDLDTPASGLTYTLATFDFTGDANAAFETYDSTDGTWNALTAGTSGSDTFTQEQVDNGHVRLNAASGSGMLSVRISDGTTTIPSTAAPAEEITVTVRVVETPSATDIGGAGGAEGLNFFKDDATPADKATPRSLTTGIGDTKITLGSGNDKVDAGLGDDEIDLTSGGKDVVIYRFGTDAMGNIVAWSGGDAITGFTPGDDALVLSDLAGGDGGSGDAFVDNLGTGFIATLATNYTGGTGGDRTSLDNYSITGVEIHFAQAVVLPGGVLGGSILSITFANPIAWADSGTPGGNDHALGFNSEWLNGAAGPEADTDAPFNIDDLTFNNNAAGKMTLTRILGLRGPEADDEVEALRSVAIGDGEANTIDLSDKSGAWVVFGGGGDDIITLGADTPPPTGATPPVPDTEEAEEIVYRLVVGDSAITTPDGSDTISEFDLGTDSLTFVDTEGTPPTATAEKSAIDVLMEAFDSVSLAFNGSGYTGITFAIDGTATLSVTFAAALDQASLIEALADASNGGDTTITDAATLAKVFTDGVPTTGSAASAALNATGLALIDTLFGMTGDENNISIGASLPAELL